MAGVSAVILDRCQVSERLLGRRHTAFRIRVRIGPFSAVVARRYSEFVALDAKLRPKMQSLPELPPKGSLKKLLPSFLDMREYRLDRLLSSMVELDPRLDNPHLQRFLYIKEAQLQVLHPITIKPEAPILASPPTSSANLRPKWLQSPDNQPIDMQALVERPEWLDALELDSVPTPSPMPTQEKMLQDLSASNRRKRLSNSTGLEDLNIDALPTLLPTQVVTKEAANEQKVAVQDNVDHPNFAGEWILEAVEGNVELLMKVLEVPWIMRKAAAASKYGVGTSKFKISQSGIRLEIEMIYGGPFPTRLAVLHADGVERDEVLHGKHLRISSHWDGNILISQRRGMGKTLPKIKRHLQDGKLVIEQVLTNGQIAKQIFVRCQSPPR